MDITGVEAGFEATATPQERATALIVAGIPEATIANVVGVGLQTVKNWHEGKASTMRKRSFDGMENLRQAMKVIIDNGVDPDYAAAWMQSPIANNPENIPITMIKQDPEKVLDGIKKLFGPADDRETIKKTGATPFSAAFAVRRSVRNIKPREFETVGLDAAYIQSIEKQRVLPRPAKRDTLLDFMGAVATEQGADGDEEKRLLLGAWWETQLDRLDISPEVTPAIASLLTLDPESQKAAAETLEKVAADLTKQ